MEFFNSNAGGIQAFFAILIFIVTSGYVLVSIRMLKEMKIQRKRLEEPSLVYYLKHIDYGVFGVIENIGQGVAYNIETKFYPEDSFHILKKKDENINFLKSLSYLAPKQSVNFFLGHKNIFDNVIGCDRHKVILRWTDDSGKPLNKGSKAVYNIDENMLKCLPDNVGLYSVVSALKDLKSVIERDRE